MFLLMDELDCRVDKAALVYGTGLENKCDEVIMSRGDRRRYGEIQGPLINRAKVTLLNELAYTYPAR